jgi:hypothetical protein
MGNYQNLERDFIERTLALITQYEGDLHQYELEQQYNYTLLINCLLGIIVMPKERTITRIPNDRLTIDLKNQMGLISSVVNPKIRTIRELIIALRHSIAHFDIQINSNDPDLLVDEIVFKDRDNEDDYEVVKFSSVELLPFIRYYGTWLIRNIEQYG